MRVKSVLMAVYLGSVVGAATSQEVGVSGDCFDRAAAYQNVDVTILRSIAFKENPKCNNALVNRNTDSTVDIGCMQINSKLLQDLNKKYGVTVNDLHDQCKNIFVGTFHYKSKILKYGNTWLAVGAYHSETPQYRDRYAQSVYQIWYKYFGRNRSN